MKFRCIILTKFARIFFSHFRENSRLPQMDWHLPENDELVASIRKKAIESYITLEKHVFPLCRDSDGQKRLRYVAVIDADSVDGIEDTLADLAGGKNVEGNPFISVRKALQRLVGMSDAEGLSYFYDEIQVMSAMEFQNHLCTFA